MSQDGDHLTHRGLYLPWGQDGRAVDKARPRTGMAQDGAARQAAYERRKRDRATTLAIALVLLARKDDAIRRSLDRPTLEAMRDSLTPTGNSRKRCGNLGRSYRVSGW